ncbi:MAG: HD domain-containing protein [Gemmatimonadaceae bacterium]|nr:HD domain-containing protein [Gemmatimonadaceae bacterium]
MRFEILRDPLWNNIRVDELTLSLVDTDVFQRLRYVRQLGLAYLVYPGATHSRFEHALGAYHLARGTLWLLAERGGVDGLDSNELIVVRAAALLHDIGHYPFSHALEEIGQLHHEDVARPLILEGEIADILAKEIAPDAPQRVFDLVRGESRSALQGLISGSLDLDKIDYLKRDAFMCGVPYGEIDVDRLTNSMVVLDDPHTGRRGIGVLEKGLSALESLLFAKYQMYRNVYWHHAVRSATAMYKRMVDDALRTGAVDADLLPSYTDEGLLHRLEHAAPTPILDALRSRRLYKRALEWPAGQLDDGYGEWIATDRDRTRGAEDEIARELGLTPGDVILDFPMKAQMLGLDIAVQRRKGEVVRLTGEGWPGTINLPTLSEELYRSARWLRVFVARRTAVDPEMVKRVLESYS